MSEREAFIASLNSYLTKAGAYVTSPMPLRGNRLRFEAPPAFAATLTTDLQRHGLRCAHIGEGERLLPSAATIIRNPKGDVVRKLDGGILPQPVSIYEVSIPAEKVNMNAGHELATRESCEERKRRLYQTKRAMVSQ
jgi:hypothetical protein